ncbi:MAG: hypothetical protein AUK03_17665 [Anaerolineae bacterium CG2_30_64_16]|nr:MAG: hypothetical protein AUK03_17665 [Anaerolineae bacterium CG2_30_64_16]
MGCAERWPRDISAISAWSLSAALQAHPLCKRVVEIETREFAADQFIFKIRAEFTHKTSFQARIYFNRGHIDYAYQLFADTPLLRWDNKEEFRSITTYPHHHHDAQGDIAPSPLTGDPIADLQTVLVMVSQFLSTYKPE